MNNLAEKILHANHAKPFGELDGAASIPLSGILRSRYDARIENGLPQVFAVMPVSDLKQIPQGIRLPEPLGMGLPGSDFFFMRGPDGDALYIDTDRQEKLWIEILDNANDADIRPVEVRGDLYAICRIPRPFQGQDCDVAPPSVAAYEANNFEHIPVEIGIAMLRGKQDPEIGTDDPTIPGF